MKVITIFQENTTWLRLTDDDNSNLSDYTTKISRLLEVSNVTILETSSGNAIMRPHKITGIKVTEVVDEKGLIVPKPDEPIDQDEPEVDKVSEEAEKIIEETEDFITDGE